jgi:predicted GNAT family acetyltransferase
MEVVTAPTAQEFLARTAHFRAHEPYLTNVMGSVAMGVIEGRPYESCHWWIAEESGEVVGAAIRTAPYHALIVPMRADVNLAIAHAIAEVFPRLPGVSGPVDQAAAFIDALQPASTTRQMDEIVYVLQSLRPESAEGSARRTVAEDEDLLTQWIHEFLVEAGLPQHNPQSGVKRMLDVGWLWEVDRTPVSMCGYAIPVGEAGHVVGRIGPVYTPKEYRRRGFAGAVTSRAVQQLQTDCDHVMLYADASNPASNGVYRRIGFAEYAQTAQFSFQYN